MANKVRGVLVEIVATSLAIQNEVENECNQTQACQSGSSGQDSRKILLRLTADMDIKIEQFRCFTSK
jgi:hypothetical protein